MTTSNFAGARFSRTKISSNGTEPRLLSRSVSSTIRSVMLMRSNTTSCSTLVPVRARTFENASNRSTTLKPANGAGPSGRSSTCPRGNTAEPSVSRAPRSSAAALYFWYSSRRRTSSARGSSSSSSPASSDPSEGASGSKLFDLMRASVAAITRYSLATSMVSVCISLRYVRYFSVMNPMGMSRMSSSCFWMIESRRSSGPSKVGSVTT